MKKKKITFAILIVLNLAFIWGNSLLPGQESGEISSGLLQWLKDMFPVLMGMGEFLLRKLGHFSEFAMLGLLLCAFFRECGQTGIHRITMPLLCGTLAAMCDETIQTFVPDRGPSVIDVWIDTSGVMTGILLLLAGSFIMTYLKERK